MIAELIRPQDPKWSEFLARTPHDFYHLPEYLEFSARHEGGTAVAFYAENDYASLLIPLLIRPIPAGYAVADDWYDAITPYGYPSPLLSPTADEASLDYFLQCFKEICEQQCIISAFFRLHPLLPLPENTLTKMGTLIKHGQTVSMDLTLTDEEIWSQVCRNHRQNIRHLRRSNFVAEIDRWDLFSEFYPIYRQTMERCGSDSFYFFSPAYFDELREAMGERMHLCTVLSPSKEVAAAGFFTCIDGIVQAHLAGTADKYLNDAPSKLMFDEARCWAKEQGQRVLHLGGGVGCCDDSLFRFKAGFSDLRHDFFSYRMILDEKRYATLEDLWRNTHPTADPHSEFFPRYRSN